MNILLISPEAWTAHAVSKHHYALTLAQLGHQVFFLDPPDPSLRRWEFNLISDEPNLKVIRGPTVARGIRFFPASLRRWIERRWLLRLEEQTESRIDVIWLFENSRFYDLRFADSRLKIYHQVDLNQNFHAGTAAATADICFCTTDFIRDRLFPHNFFTYKIHHGTPLPVARGSLSLDQSARFLAGGINAVYVGNLDMHYLDVDLLAEAARAHPAVRFHFVGGYSETGLLHRLAGCLDNVVWWNKVPSSLIPAILERADLLLVTYQAARWRDQASPHKFMEYFASGKTVVSTYTDEYKDKRHLIEMADQVTDYLPTLDRVLSNLAHYNSAARMAERKSFAEAHTYKKQISRIFQLIHKQSMEKTRVESRS